MRKFRLLKPYKIHASKFFSFDSPWEKAGSTTWSVTVSFDLRPGSILCLWRGNNDSFTRKDVFWIDLFGCAYSRNEIIMLLREEVFVELLETPKLPRPM